MSMKNLTSVFTNIANAIRSKSGKSAKINPNDMPSEIINLSAGSGGITPTGTVDIQSNGTHDVSTYANANVNVPIPSGYVKPSGTKDVTDNGSYDVNVYKYVNVDVDIPDISEVVPTFSSNGTYMASADGFDGYKGVIVDVDIPDISEVIPTFSSNGTYMASADGFDGYKGVIVEVDPPTGTKNITTNGTHDVSNYAKASVNVPSLDISETIPTFSSNGTYLASADGFDGYKGVIVEVDPPTGTKNITTNGTHDVSNYATANVDVAMPTIMSETKTITSNGSYDALDDGVAGYSHVVVDVQDSGNVQPMATAQLLITGSAFTGDEVCIPYYENGELKHCYGYESLGGMMTDGWVTFQVPVGAMVMLRNVSFTKTMGTFEDVSSSFSFLGSEAGWYIMTDATELALNS